MDNKNNQNDNPNKKKKKRRFILVVSCFLLQNYRNMRTAQRLQTLYYIESKKIKFHPL